MLISFGFLSAALRLPCEINNFPPISYHPMEFTLNSTLRMQSFIKLFEMVLKA